MKVIFLDIDGVLIRYGEPARSLNRECTLRLCRIVAETGAKLVISSSWRIALYDQLLDMLDQYGLREHVIGTTESVPIPDDANSDWLERMRYHEIRAWLDAHPRVTHYLAIDDERYALPGHQLVTIYNRGLEDAHVERAITLLNRDDFS